MTLDFYLQEDSNIEILMRFLINKLKCREQYGSIMYCTQDIFRSAKSALLSAHWLSSNFYPLLFVAKPVINQYFFQRFLFRSPLLWLAELKKVYRVKTSLALTLKATDADLQSDVWCSFWPSLEMAANLA